MSEKTAAGNTAAFKLNPLCADDVWDLIKIISKVGVMNIQDHFPPDLVKAARFRKPMMIDKKTNKPVEMPRNKWTDKQIQAETDAQIAQEKLSMLMIGAVIDNIGNCKSDVNNLLARGAGKTTDEISSMPAIDYINLMSAFVSRDEFSDFFKQALRLAQTQMKSSTSLSDDMGKA